MKVSKGDKLYLRHLSLEQERRIYLTFKSMMKSARDKKLSDFLGLCAPEK